MCTTVPKPIIRRVVEYDPVEMARRGRLGGLATGQRHDSRELTRSGREAFLARFSSPADRSAYFTALARKSAAARRVGRASAATVDSAPEVA